MAPQWSASSIMARSKKLSQHAETFDWDAVSFKNNHCLKCLSIITKDLVWFFLLFLIKLTLVLVIMVDFDMSLHLIAATFSVCDQGLK